LIEHSFISDSETLRLAGQDDATILEGVKLVLKATSPLQKL